MATRNRVIYQSEAVYCTIDTPYSGLANKAGGMFGAGGIGQYATKDLQRIQSANYSFNISRTDVNQFGQLGAIDQIITESPSVSFDSSYLVANFTNEARLGFYVTNSGTAQPFRSCISKLVDSTTPAYLKDFFILQAKEGKDADVETSGSTATSGQWESIIGIGNAGLTSYSVEAAVGGFPTASFSAEGLNMNFNNVEVVMESGTAATETPYYIYGVNPAINPEDGRGLTSGNGSSIHACTVALPAPTGNAGAVSAGEVSVLRPGDIRLFLAKQTSEDVGNAAVATSMDSPNYAGASISNAHIQSFNISFDLSRSSIEQLGTKFAYARLIDFPISLSMGIDAVVSDLTTGSLAEIINCDDKFDARIQMFSPDCAAYGADKGSAQVALNYILKGLKLDSQSFSLGLGDNKTVSLSFSTQIGGPEQSGMGLFMSGYTGNMGPN